MAPSGTDWRSGSSRHPMVAHLELEAPFQPEALHDYSVPELLKFALTTNDYWAELALGWLEDGAAPGEMEQALRDASRERHLGQALRHRALRLAKLAAAPDARRAGG